jgi:DNA-binding transcriptional LysR family regulator
MDKDSQEPKTIVEQTICPGFKTMTPPLSITLQQLIYFVTVARERNFTRAAALCHVAQPALSQQIAKLEHALGASVCVRSKRGVQLTAEGLDFLGYAERSLDLLSEGKRRISDMNQLRLGSVTVLCTPTIATYWLPKTIMQYRQLFPNVELRIVEQPGCAPQDLEERAVDFGIVQIEPKLSSRTCHPVHEEPLFVEEQVLVVPVTHPLVGNGRDAYAAIPFALLNGESFILPKPPCGVSGIAARAFAIAGIQPKIVLETNQVEAVCQMVSAGLGIGLIPRMAMAREYSKLRWRSITAPTLTRTIGIVWSRSRGLSAAAVALIGLLRDEAKTEGQVRMPSHGRPRLVENRIRGTSASS